MNETYLINLDPDQDEVLDFEVANKNLGKILVEVVGNQSPPTGEGYRVQLGLSADAMIGFGIALIRKAMASRGIGSDPKIDYEPIEPIHNGLLLDQIGMFLVPGSAQLQIFLEDFGTIDDAVKESKKILK